MADIIVLAVVRPMKETTITANKDHILDLCKSYSDVVDKLIQMEGEEYLKSGYLAELISQIKIKDVPSSYAYIVDEEDILLYHPEQGKIGKPIENDDIKQLTAMMKNGQTLENNISEYTYNGKVKYAGYSMINDNNTCVEKLKEVIGKIRVQKT